VRRAEARRPGARAVAGPQAVAAAAEREAWLRGKVEASVFARWLQDVEDGCLGCVSRRTRSHLRLLSRRRKASGERVG
jgi:hypothetical protein